MLHQLAVACAAVVGLVAVWVAVQALVRRTSPHTGDPDVLACRMCAADGTCTCGLKAYIMRRRGNADREEHAR